MNIKNNKFVIKISLTFILCVSISYLSILRSELVNVYNMINNFLFADLMALSNKKSIGLFYIVT